MQMLRPVWASLHRCSEPGRWSTWIQLIHNPCSLWGSAFWAVQHGALIVESPLPCLEVACAAENLCLRMVLEDAHHTVWTQNWKRMSSWHALGANSTQG